MRVQGRLFARVWKINRASRFEQARDVCVSDENYEISQLAERNRVRGTNFQTLANRRVSLVSFDRTSECENLSKRGGGGGGEAKINIGRREKIIINYSIVEQS